MAKTLLVDYLMLQLIQFHQAAHTHVIDHLVDTWPGGVSGSAPTTASGTQVDGSAFRGMTHTDGQMHGHRVSLQDSRVGGGFPEYLCTSQERRRVRYSRCGDASLAQRLHRGLLACVLLSPILASKGRMVYFTQKAESADDGGSQLRFSTVAAARFFFFFFKLKQ